MHQITSNRALRRTDIAFGGELYRVFLVVMPSALAIATALEIAALFAKRKNIPGVAQQFAQPDRRENPASG
jgi:hypothetical protein